VIRAGRFKHNAIGGPVQRDTVVCTESCGIRKRRVDFSYSDLTCILQRDKCFRDFGREQILTLKQGKSSNCRI
jgi:hypothetical protein